MSPRYLYTSDGIMWCFAYLSNLDIAEIAYAVECPAYKWSEMKRSHTLLNSLAKNLMRIYNLCIPSILFRNDG